jgi:hypothetical protein
MKRWMKWAGLLALLALCGLVLAWACLGWSRGFRIRVPRNIQPEGGVCRISIPQSIQTEDVVISYKRPGAQLVWQMKTAENVRDYDIPMEKDRSISLYAYCPGYRFAWVENPPLDRPWMPEFQPLAQAELTGRLINSKGEGMPNEGLRFGYEPDEVMMFYGHGVWNGPIGEICMAATKTAADGTFRVKLSCLNQDPFCRKFGGEEHREFILGLDRPYSPLEWDIHPRTIPVMDRYDEALVIRWVIKGKLIARIPPGFLKKIGITGAVWTPWGLKTDASHFIGMGSQFQGRPWLPTMFLGKDLSFSEHLQPGEYTLWLTERENSCVDAQAIRRWMVGDSVAVKENETTEITLEWGDKEKEAVKNRIHSLTQMLGDGQADARMKAMRSLGDFGPEAKEAVRELERLAEKDTNESVRKAAHDALEKIRR